MIRIPAPAALNGGLLEAQLHDAGLLAATVALSDDTLLVDRVDDDDLPLVESVVDAHPAKAKAEAQRMTGERSNESTIRDRAEQALTVNQAYRESAIPATVAARLTRLEQEAERANRQRSGLIRLLLNRFDGTD